MCQKIWIKTQPSRIAFLSTTKKNKTKEKENQQQQNMIVLTWMSPRQLVRWKWRAYAVARPPASISSAKRRNEKKNEAKIGFDKDEISHLVW